MFPVEFLTLGNPTATILSYTLLPGICLSTWPQRGRLPQLIPNRPRMGETRGKEQSMSPKNGVINWFVGVAALLLIAPVPPACSTMSGRVRRWQRLHGRRVRKRPMPVRQQRRSVRRRQRLHQQRYLFIWNLRGGDGRWSATTTIPVRTTPAPGHGLRLHQRQHQLLH